MTSHLLTIDTAWQEALAIYALPGAADHLIKLQDNYGCNVNLILLCIVLGNRQFSLERMHIEQLISGIEQSERQLALHRELRRAAKLGAAKAYERLKQHELILEQRQHTLLLTTLNQFNLTRVNTDAKSMLGLVLEYYAVPQSEIEASMVCLADALK
ncbi:TIGR02444 family protein [Alteromonas sp. ASW11-36]|uniref:TIGR02444 family protein n=1 Tax=Alteromonas arenosi TaxID=3055817 RepID=A0ABT7T2T2_9ALTE|nr:TIGR02444 family protein [Alteromonas sp. ASW11-36]MDM7862064.1 TIGR02444 family protein [Alteromonas sp. ASW11-36]